MLVAAGPVTAAAPPEIRNTSYAKDETSGAVVVGADVVGASNVIARIGRKGARQRITLSSAERRGRAATWSGEVPEYKEQCAPVTFIAENAAGKREFNEEKVCVFGPPEPEPPSPTLPNFG